MAKISAGDAALYGFNAFKKDPLAMALYYALFIGSFAAITVAFGAQMQEAFTNYMTALQGLEGAGDPAEVFPAISGAMAEFFLAPGMILSFVVWAVIAILFQTAILRVLLRDEARGFTNIGFGADEIRVLVANIIVYPLVYLLIVLGSTIVGLIGGFAGSFIGGFAAIIIVAGGIAVLCFGTYVGAVFSVSAALSMQKGGFYVFGAPGFMKGFGGSILGAHVLGFFITVLVMIAVWVATMIVGSIVGINMMGSDPAAMGFGEPRYILVQAVSYIGTILTALIWVGIPAYYVRQLSQIDASVE
jgi:hypothetical protein